ncbi:hypothetical protein ABVK25_012570 [Lepraria finkii]|uniref:Uncharacterized protein n=1 Tax=Lepraria finkii TaxID=1340010 RepID=A0ABR4AIL6_9LECA
MITGRGAARPASPSVPESNRGPTWPTIHLPLPEFSKASPQSAPRRRLGPQSDLGISSSDGGPPSPVTPGGRIPVHGRSPECVNFNVGQRPTAHRTLRRSANY